MLRIWTSSGTTPQETRLGQHTTQFGKPSPFSLLSCYVRCPSTVHLSNLTLFLHSLLCVKMLEAALLTSRWLHFRSKLRDWENLNVSNTDTSSLQHHKTQETLSWLQLGEGMKEAEWTRKRKPQNGTRLTCGFLACPGSMMSTALCFPRSLNQRNPLYLCSPSIRRLWQPLKQKGGEALAACFTQSSLRRAGPRGRSRNRSSAPVGWLGEMHAVWPLHPSECLMGGGVGGKHCCVYIRTCFYALSSLWQMNQKDVISI